MGSKGIWIHCRVAKSDVAIMEILERTDNRSKLIREALRQYAAAGESPRAVEADAASDRLLGIERTLKELREEFARLQSQLVSRPVNIGAQQEKHKSEGGTENRRDETRTVNRQAGSDLSEDERVALAATRVALLNFGMRKDG